jgi:MFS family permease
VLEVLGFRLFAPYFGSSVYVTGTLVGIVLAALSLGYLIGGTLADRRPEERVMYAAILAAAVYLAVMLLVYRALLEAFQTWGLVAGTLAAASTIFVPPMLALSIVSPYLVRLAAVHERIGSVAGRMFAVSTVGSIAGSFLATFVLVPQLGSHATVARLRAPAGGARRGRSLVDDGPHGAGARGVAALPAALRARGSVRRPAHRIRVQHDRDPRPPAASAS